MDSVFASRYRQVSRKTPSGRVPSYAFWTISVLLFVSCVVATIISYRSMSAMGGIQMPGNWTMSMAWLRMPGQTWPEAALSFIGMWTVMMIPMMLPALIPTLRRYHHMLSNNTVSRFGWQTFQVMGAYFFVWTLLGVIIYLLGGILAAAEMSQSHLAYVTPAIDGLVIIFAGVLQRSPWKIRQLASCRTIPCDVLATDAHSAWRQGLRLGLHCCYSCLSLMIILFSAGMMNIYAMAVVTAAITLERLAPAGERVARFIGILAITGGGVIFAVETILRL